MKWRVHLRPEVIHYLFSFRESGTEIRAAIGRLSTEGVPKDAKLTPNTNRWLWVDAKHWITCVVHEEEQALHVTNVEHVEEAIKRLFDSSKKTPGSL